METLIIEPKNQKQLAKIKAFLKSLDVSFRQEKETEANIPSHVISGIRKGQEDIKAGKSISLEEFKEKIVSFK
ncbi:MAG: DUF2683 family protein [Daejeonella sp.]|uniref:DUF2683 family protein n=1 Tax=Daejeonella sp. TaxID=2805397 RepID=UPI003C7899D8